MKSLVEIGGDRTIGIYRRDNIIEGTRNAGCRTTIDCGTTSISTVGPRIFATIQGCDGNRSRYDVCTGIDLLFEWLGTRCVAKTIQLRWYYCYGCATLTGFYTCPNYESTVSILQLLVYITVPSWYMLLEICSVRIWQWIAVLLTKLSLSSTHFSYFIFGLIYIYILPLNSTPSIILNNKLLLQGLFGQQ